MALLLLLSPINPGTTGIPLETPKELSKEGIDDDDLSSGIGMLMSRSSGWGDEGAADIRGALLLSFVYKKDTIYENINESILI